MYVLKIKFSDHKFDIYTLEDVVDKFYGEKEDDEKADGEVLYAHHHHKAGV